MGVIVDSDELVRELNVWFDEIWSLSSSPDIEQGASYLEKLENQQVPINIVGHAFSSTALRVRAKLTERGFPNTTGTSRSTKEATSTPLIETFVDLPISKVDEFVYRIVLVFDFENEKTIPKPSQLENLTGLGIEEQIAILNTLRNARFFEESADDSGLHLFRLNENFEWISDWSYLDKARNLWESKMTQLTRRVTLPKDATIISASEQQSVKDEARSADGVEDTAANLDDQEDELIILTPGVDHAFSSNIAFADAVYAQLCKSLAENGGMLSIPSDFIFWIHGDDPLAYVLTQGNALAPVSRSAISSVLSDRVDGLPPSPFKVFHVASEDLVKANDGHLPQYPIHIALQGPIVSSEFPLAAKAGELASLKSIWPENYILTERQVNFLNQRCLKFFQQARGCMLPEDVMDEIYAVIAMEAQLHRNQIPYSKSKLQNLIAARVNIKREIIDLFFRDCSPFLKKLLHIATFKDGAGNPVTSIVHIRKSLLESHPKTKEIVDNGLAESVLPVTSGDWENQHCIVLGKSISLLDADFVYEKFIEMRPYWGRHIPIQEEKILFTMVAENSGVAYELVASILKGINNNIPKMFYLDIGVIQKGMIFVFLNSLLSSQDWNRLPKAKAALARVGEGEFAKLA